MDAADSAAIGIEGQLARRIASAAPGTAVAEEGQLSTGCWRHGRAATGCATCATPPAPLT